MTVTTLLDLEGYSQRDASFVFDLLDTDGAVIGETNPVTTVTVDNNTTRKVKRTLNNVRFDAAETSDINHYSDRLRPRMLIGGESFPLGVFAFADASTRIMSWGDELDGVLVDLLLTVDHALPTAVSFAAGDSMSEAARRILNLSTLPTAAVVDNVGSTFGSSVLWPPGKSLLTITNEIAATAGMLDLYVDNGGVPRLVLPVDPDDASAISYQAGGRIYEGSIVESEDLAAPNRWIVVDTNAKDMPVVGVYDLADSSPQSFASRGFHITETFEIQGVGTIAAATTAAKTKAEQSRSGRTVTFEGPPDPRHDTYDTVEFLGTRYREVSWSMPLVDGASMTHELSEVV